MNIDVGRRSLLVSPVFFKQGNSMGRDTNEMQKRLGRRNTKKPVRPEKEK